MTNRPEWLTDELQQSLIANQLEVNSDGLLMLWQRAKDQLAFWKEREMELRKISVKVIAPDATEGTNNIDLGAGYVAKAVVKFNYTLLENDKVESGLDKIAKTGNEGAFIADRLVNWHPTFSTAEYRELQNNASSGNSTAIEILRIVNEFLVIKEAAPSLDIKAPKEKKK